MSKELKEIVLVIATSDHEHGLHIKGNVYESSAIDTKRNQVFVADERKIGCWYSWENFTKLKDFTETMKQFEVNYKSYES